jgi:hypothetical protein
VAFGKAFGNAGGFGGAGAAGAAAPAAAPAGGGLGGAGAGAGGEDDGEVVEGQDLADADVGKAEDSDMNREKKFEVRGKLFKQADAYEQKDGKMAKTGSKEFKEMGTGQLQVLFGNGPNEGKRYLLMRDEKLGKIILNTLLVANMKFINAQKGNIRFMLPIPEPETDETGKIIDHNNVTNVMTLLNLKVNKANQEKTFEELQKAVPKV